MAGLLGALQRCYHVLPQSVRRELSPATNALRYSIDANARRRRDWLAHDYGAFGNRQREEIFLAIARFCHINRPSDGYYMEFGCHSGRTMKMAWKHSRHLFDWTYVAFDSFEGLPEIGERERQEIWQAGKLKTAEDEFVSILTAAGMPRNRLITVKGFYDESLDDALKSRLLPKKAAAIYIDCDLYASTVPVLEFVKAFLRIGTVIVFDDWNCFHADPNKGERLAFREFCERHPELKFEPFYRTAEAMAFVYVGP